MKNILVGEDFMCPDCYSTNYKTLTSVTNSTYEYCTDCNYNIEKALKQKDFDSIFKKIIEYLKSNTNESFKIEITKDYKKLNLIVNDINLASYEFSYNLLSKDIYFLENTIHELVEDFYSDYIFKNDIIICA